MRRVMSKEWLLILVPAAFSVSGAWLMAADTASTPPAWASKQVAQWSDDDAKQVLADSGWVKTMTPTIARGNQDSGGGYPQRGNVGFGVPGIGFPGGPGGGRRGGMGRYPQQPNPNRTSSSQDPPKLTLRWESALPIREAELKTKDNNAPTLEDENHYAIAVYGIPITMLKSDFKSQADDCKKKSSLKRDGKKDIKPSSVQVLRREDGPVVLFLFPRKDEITADDRRVEFDAEINHLSLTQSFYIEDMSYQGKTEL